MAVCQPGHSRLLIYNAGGVLSHPMKAYRAGVVAHGSHEVGGAKY